MNPSNNFGSYHSSLKAALWRAEGAGDDRERIVIPFFSLFVKDMYFLNEGCANRQDNGDINFEKFWEMAKQITEFLTWKQVEVRAFIQLSHILRRRTGAQDQKVLGSIPRAGHVQKCWANFIFSIAFVHPSICTWCTDSRLDQ